MVYIKKELKESDEPKPKGMPGWLIVIIVAVPLFIGSMVFYNWVKAGDEAAMADLYNAAEGVFESFTMKDINGKEYTEEIFKGHKVNMINIWQTRLLLI